MSSLIGQPEERWPLARAVDALSAAVRQAARPGWIWITGLLYPSVTLGLSGNWDGLASVIPQSKLYGADSWVSAIFAADDLGDRLQVMLLPIVIVPCTGFLFVPLARFIVGLARLGHPLAWTRAAGGKHNPSFAAAWRAGHGLTWSSFGLWLQIVLMMIGVILLFGLPLTFMVESLSRGDEEPLRVALIGAVLAPVLIFTLLYTLSLSVLYQLALHSLAHNRRGVGSALLHAWRIMRHDVWATARSILVDVLLFVVVYGMWRFVDGLIGGLPGGEYVMAFLALMMIGFLGVARAGYWARVYRALGGLSPEDGVPGLEERAQLTEGRTA
jgi:hypothetical protein